MIQEHIKKILENAISLEKYGMRDLAWKREEAEKLISLLIFEDIGILGGDVYRLDSFRLIPTYDNWSCEPKEGELKNNFFSRSKKVALDYIKHYPIELCEKIIFSLVFTEILD
jgi:hypothetical protein